MSNSCSAAATLFRDPLNSLLFSPPLSLVPLSLLSDRLLPLLFRVCHALDALSSLPLPEHCTHAPPSPPFFSTQAKASNFSVLSLTG